MLKSGVGHFQFVTYTDRRINSLTLSIPHTCTWVMVCMCEPAGGECSCVCVCSCVCTRARVSKHIRLRTASWVPPAPRRWIDWAPWQNPLHGHRAGKPNPFVFVRKFEQGFRPPSAAAAARQTKCTAWPPSLPKTTRANYRQRIFVWRWCATASMCGNQAHAHPPTASSSHHCRFRHRRRRLIVLSPHAHLVSGQLASYFIIQDSRASGNFSTIERASKWKIASKILSAIMANMASCICCTCTCTTAARSGGCYGADHMPLRRTKHPPLIGGTTSIQRSTPISWARSRTRLPKHLYQRIYTIYIVWVYVCGCARARIWNRTRKITHTVGWQKNDFVLCTVVEQPFDRAASLALDGHAYGFRRARLSPNNHDPGWPEPVSAQRKHICATRAPADTHAHALSNTLLYWIWQKTDPGLRQRWCGWMVYDLWSDIDK